MSEVTISHVYSAGLPGRKSRGTGCGYTGLRGVRGPGCARASDLRIRRAQYRQLKGGRLTADGGRQTVEGGERGGERKGGRSKGPGGKPGEEAWVAWLSGMHGFGVAWPHRRPLTVAG